MNNDKFRINRNALPLMAIALFVAAGASAAPLPDNFGYDVFDETTGFVVHTQNDPWGVYSNGTWDKSIYWTTEKPPESGTNYYSNGYLVYFPKTINDFPGDLLAHDGILATPQASRRLTFADFIGLPGGEVEIRSTGQGFVVQNKAMFTDSADDPFKFVLNSSFLASRPYPYIIDIAELDGDPDCVLTFGERPNPCTNFLWKFDIAITVDDASDFKGKFLFPDCKVKFNDAGCDFGGTMELTNRWIGVSATPDGTPVTNTPARLRSAGVPASVKGLVLHEGTELLLDADSDERGDWTVGDLTMAGGAVTVTCEVNENTGKTLHVTNSLTIAEGCRFIVKNTAAAWGTVTRTSVPVTNVLVTFAKEVDLSDVTADDFLLDMAPFESVFGKDVIALPVLVLEESPDGSHELCLTRNPMVYNRSYSELGGEKSFAYDDADAWSDGKVPHSGSDYLIAYNERQPQLHFDGEEGEKIVFPAENLFARNCEVFTRADLTVTNFVLANGVCLHMNVRADHYRLDGRLGVFSSEESMANLNVKEGVEFELASDLYGTGFFWVRGVGQTTFTGNNEAFSGNLKVNFAGTRFRIGNASSLGGAMASFTHDGVLLGDEGDGISLEPISSFRVNEPTRGIMISNEVGVIVGDGVEFGIDSVLTYRGRLEKTGAGTLSLGAKPRFEDGTETAVPVEGRNLLVVSEGAIAVTDADALNGLDVRFAEGASLALECGATGDLAAYGVRMTDAASAVSPLSGASCLVTLDIADDFRSGSVFNIATFADEAAASAAMSVMRVRPKGSLPGCASELSAVGNADGTWTVRARMFRVGLIISVR